MRADNGLTSVAFFLFFRESLLGGGSEGDGFNRGRVLGKPQETEITRGLDNQGLVAYQRETITGKLMLSVSLTDFDLACGLTTTYCLQTRTRPSRTSKIQ